MHQEEILSYVVWASRRGIISQRRLEEARSRHRGYKGGLLPASSWVMTVTILNEIADVLYLSSQTGTISARNTDT